VRTQEIHDFYKDDSVSLIGAPWRPVAALLRSMTKLGSFGERSVSLAMRTKMQAGKSEINVTPLIDVLLVLLITFMVITPLLRRGLPTDLAAKPTADLPEEAALVLRISANGQLSINTLPVPVDALAPTIRNIFSSRANKVLFLSADKSLQYREVAQLIDRIRGISPEIQVGFMP
jgi:biopolymer transport protein TolR